MPSKISECKIRISNADWFIAVFEDLVANLFRVFQNCIEFFGTHSIARACEFYFYTFLMAAIRQHVPDRFLFT